MIESKDIAIGTQYIGKWGKSTVVDIHKTYNAAGQLIRTSYVTSHDFMGQQVQEYDVLAITIQRGHIA